VLHLNSSDDAIGMAKGLPLPTALKAGSRMVLTFEIVNPPYQRAACQVEVKLLLDGRAPSNNTNLPLPDMVDVDLSCNCSITELQKVTSADGDFAPLLIHAPGFEIASITATTNFPGVRNAVVVTLISNVDLAKDSISISGLRSVLGSSSHHVAIYGKTGTAGAPCVIGQENSSDLSTSCAWLNQRELLHHHY
jgi:hypothetical protein